MATPTTKKSKIETMTLKPSETAAAIRSMSGTKRSLFIWGPPGISKSAIARQVAESMDMAFIDVRLSQMDPTDLRGIPFPVKEGGVQGVRWSAPLVLPRDLDFNVAESVEAEETLFRFLNPYNTTPTIKVSSLTEGLRVDIVSQEIDNFTVVLRDENNKPAAGRLRWSVTGKVRAILALEEFNSAPPSVQAAAYQLVLDRALGEYKVPDGVQIVGMGNRDTDKGVTFKMPTLVMNRFVHVEMAPDFDDWQRWALSERIHPEVVGFLSAFKNKLFQFEAASASRGFPTPRSWHAVSDILGANDDMPEMVSMGLITGSVGDAAGLEFLSFRDIAAELPRVESILNGSLKEMPKKVEPSLAYALTTTLCYELKERSDNIRRKHGDKWNVSPDRKNWLQEADNFLGFMLKNFQPEICIMGAKAAIAIHKLPFEVQKMKHFEVFATKYRDLIIAK